VRRALVIGLMLAFAAGGVVTSLGAGGGPAGRTYDIVFDNAFGLVKGADFKVGGVAVGTIRDLDVRRSDARAVVSVEVTRSQGFGALRSDAHCTVAPQSLIGEYFVDCQPGTTGRVLRSGDTIPVADTESPIPPDLVLDVMRRPERERFSIVLSALGAGLAARGDDLNATIRRAIPAVGSTDAVLRVLDAKRRTLQDLSRDSGTVLKVLGRRRADVGRFVTTAKDTAEATADRRKALAGTFERLPGFLDELTPTMDALGTAAREQTPALADLRAASGSVSNLLDTLRPFSKALEPATTTLGDAGRSGRTAARASSRLVSLLARLGGGTREPAKNLAIILSDLDDRSRAFEPDPDSPGGKGYTGLEAPLQYVFDQSLAVNIFDQRGYALKLDLLADQCSGYTTAEQAKADEARYRRCAQGLGPDQPGITTPDPSPPMTASIREPSTRKQRSTRRGDAGAPRPAAGATPAPSSPSGPAPSGDRAPAPSATPLPGTDALPSPQPLLDKLLDPLKPLLGGGQKSASPTPTPTPAPSGQPAQDLLDFLLSP
jgi:virulence factor Mce-like protein